MDIFEELGEVALSEAILDGDVCLTLRKIQEHLVRCAKNDGFSEFYESDVDDDCNMIEEDCVSIARMLYTNPIWLYNGPAVSSNDRMLNKQKIMEAIRKCTSSLKDDEDKAHNNNDDGYDDSFDKVTTDEENDEDGEGSESTESDEIHAGDVCSDGSQSGGGDHEEDVHESHENVCDEDTEADTETETETETTSSSEEDENETYENGDKSLLKKSNSDEAESGDNGDNDNYDDDGAVDDVSDVSFKNDIADDDCISLNLSPEDDNAAVIEEDEEIVDWVDDMDMEEVLRIDRCYMKIDDDIINDFEFFK